MDRVEKDALGERLIERGVLYGVHTSRAMENFPFLRRPVPSVLVRAYGLVKKACLQTCAELNCWPDSPAKVEAMLQSCSEMSEGLLDQHIMVDLMQGGAGTSLNMNVNEVLANRALQLLGRNPGDYEQISPLDDVNRYQSTNDTFPTALKLAAIYELHRLEQSVVDLGEAFRDKEKEFADIVKVGRTQYQDAVLTTLGREMGAYAEALARDRWRLYKCVERLRVVNLGGTAVGSGLAAERKYIFRATDHLRQLSGVALARAENLFEATQNLDVFIEVSGILKACAGSLLKICSDLRLLSSGPNAGLGEVILPPRQAGSSIMPGKVNPVIPEAVSQAAMQTMGNDMVIAHACASGSLELNAFLPLVAANLLDSLDLLTTGCDILHHHCVSGLQANADRCRETVEHSTSVLTALVARLGYEECSRIADEMEREKTSVRRIVVDSGRLSEAEFDLLTSSAAVSRLGFVRQGEGKERMEPPK